MRCEALKRPQAVDGPGGVEHSRGGLDQEVSPLVQLRVGLDPQILEKDA